MELCGELLALLDEMPELGIVVTSSHREGRYLRGVQRLLPTAVARRVVGLTPVTPNCRAPGGRQAEIEAWLLLHPVVRRYAAVDDESHLYEANCRWLVTTHSYVGWDTEATSKLRALLAPLSRISPR